jgi:hypothetical protein
MHPLTRQTLAEVSRRGHSIDLDKHLDAIICLDAAARDSQAVGIQEEVDWLDRPIVVGNVELRPLSFAGKLLITAFNDSGWFADDPEVDALAIAYTLANSRNAEAMRAVGTTERQAARTIKRWARNVDASIGALLQASRRMMQPARTLADGPAVVLELQDRAKQDTGYVSGLLARLAHEFGKDSEYWLFAPWAEVNAAMNLLRKDAEEMNKAMGKKGAPDPEDPAVQAFARWRKAQQQFLNQFPTVE